MRPPDYYEYSAIGSVLSAAAHELRDILIESYGGFHMDSDCEQCLTYTDTAPRGFTRDTRMTWFWFLANTDGYYANNVGLEMLVNHSSTDTSQFHIIDIVYNSQTFPSVAALKAAYYNNTVPGFRRAVLDSTVWQDSADGTSNYASMRRRGPSRALETLTPPQLVTPQGARFAVRGNTVYWMGWQMHIGHSILSGSIFRDVRFRGERILYEMGLQEAWAGYSDIRNPSQVTSHYLDSSWGMARSMYELVEGVDCPVGSVFLNVTFLSVGTFWPAGDALTLPRAVCIYEEASQASAARHFDNNFAGGFNFIAASPLTRLVVKTTSTVYNYDYTYETSFYPDGSIEYRAIASGYLQSTYFDPVTHDWRSVGNRVHNYTMGSLHDHFWSIKCDLDILGTANSLMRHEFKARTTTFNYTYFPRGALRNKYVEHTMVPAEAQGQSSMVYNPQSPVVFAIGNTNRQNKWGTMRAYKIQLLQTAGQLLDDTAWHVMPSAQWLKYHTVVTRRSDNITQDRVGYSMFDQAATAEPVQRFDDWAFSGDSLMQQDLVAWVTIGSLHMPHAEDIPVTYSIGTTSAFMLKPMNYFDESALTDLTSSVYVKSDGSVSETNINVASGQECFAPASPFQFRGGQVVA